MCVTHATTKEKRKTHTTKAGPKRNISNNLPSGKSYKIKRVVNRSVKPAQKKIIIIIYCWQNN